MAKIIYIKYSLFIHQFFFTQNNIDKIFLTYINNVNIIGLMLFCQNILTRKLYKKEVC